MELSSVARLVISRYYLLPFIFSHILPYAELGCPAIFEAKLEKVPKTAPDDRLNSLASSISKQDQK